MKSLFKNMETLKRAVRQGSEFDNSSLDQASFFKEKLNSSRLTKEPAIFVQADNLRKTFPIDPKDNIRSISEPEEISMTIKDFENIFIDTIPFLEKKRYFLKEIITKNKVHSPAPSKLTPHQPSEKISVGESFLEQKEEHQAFLETDCFLVSNKQNNYHFFSYEQIQGRADDLYSSLNKLIQALKEIPFRDGMNISASNENDFQKSLCRLFPKEYFKNESILQIFSATFRIIRRRRPSDNSSKKILYKYLIPTIYGVRPPSFYINDYKLHEAVFQNNLPLIRRICAKEVQSNLLFYDVNQADLLGITPLTLAIKLGRSDAVLILTDHGANPDLRPLPFVNTPLEEAISLKSQIMIKNLIIAKHREKQIKWEASKGKH